MTAQRSPGYPSMSLSHAIDLTKKLHLSNRTNPTDREAAAKDLGYSSLNGASAKTLSDLAHFDLVERAGKSGLKVTQTAVDILYPESSAGKRLAIERAAAAPDLFAKLNSHFSDGLPSKNSLEAFLVRNGYASAAIPHIMKSYTETIQFAAEHGESESHGLPDEKGSELPHQMEVDNTMNAQQAAPQYPQAASPAVVQLALNQVNMNIQADIVHLNATLDYEGLLILKKKIEGLMSLMGPN
jgi:hypothetical protein